MLLQQVQRIVGLGTIDFLDGLEQRDRRGYFASEVYERLQVLGQARPAKAQASVQEAPAQASVQPHGVHDRIDVHSQALAQSAYLVGVGDFGAEQAVGGVLGHLSRPGGGLDNGRAEGRVKRLQ